jgi:hypothetical protein
LHCGSGPAASSSWRVKHDNLDGIALSIGD